MDLKHAQSNKKVLLQLLCASVIRLCKTTMVEVPSISNKLTVFKIDSHGEFTAELVADCNIECLRKGIGTEVLY